LLRRGEGEGSEGGGWCEGEGVRLPLLQGKALKNQQLFEIEEE